MRCKNNPLCNAEKLCDNCDTFTKSVKQNFNLRYNQQNGNGKNITPSKFGNYPDRSQSCLEESNLNDDEAISSKMLDTSQGFRLTRLRKKGEKKLASTMSLSILA